MQNNKIKLFNFALNHVWGVEGGYVDDSDDRGGKTNYGITQTTYDRWNEYKNRKTKPVKEITKLEASSIYWEFYWIKGSCYLLSNKVAVVHFDSCINHGVKQAIKFLQRCYNIVDDGIIGPQTRSSIKNSELTDDELVNLYINQRQKFYYILVNNDRSQKKFLNGWLNRLKSLDKFLEEVEEKFVSQNVTEKTISKKINTPIDKISKHQKEDFNMANIIFKMFKPIIKKQILKEIKNDKNQKKYVELINLKIDIPNITEDKEEKFLNDVYDAVQELLIEYIENL